MYIPKEAIFYILGFISCPIVVYIIGELKGWNKEEKENEKDIK